MINKAIFFDRDDTLIEDPGYINDPGQVKLLEGVAEALIELKAMGYKLIVVSNQSGVARGIVTEKVLVEIHERLRYLLAERGTYLDKIYYCPYHPEGTVSKYSKESDMRKPNAGMFFAAAKELDIDLGQSWMIGNSSRDIEAGLKAGCKTILTEQSSQDKTLEVCEPEPDYRAVNIKEAVNIIKMHYRSGGKTEKQNKSGQKIAEEETVIEREEMERKNSNEISGGPRTEQLLLNILEQLKRNHRTEMFDEFSALRFLAGIVQGMVVLCLLISIWFLMSSNKEYNSLIICLGFAILLQLMSLTFYVMQRKK